MLLLYGEAEMSRKALIEISLVEESDERTNDEIAKEILKELTDSATVIPWCGKVNKVVVVET